MWLFLTVIILKCQSATALVGSSDFIVWILQRAKSLIEKAETRGGYTFLFQSDSRKIAAALEEAKKDNSFIYHAKVPDHSKMPPIGRHIWIMIIFRAN